MLGQLALLLPRLCLLALMGLGPVRSATVLRTEGKAPMGGFTFRFKMEGRSMEPTLHNGQTLLVSTDAYRRHPPRRWDIVVFRAVPAGQPRRYYVKRIIGLPRETVAVHSGAVYINGRSLNEPYPHYRASYTFSARRVPKNNYFVLGDNRNNSYDSHVWGWLDRRYVVGKVSRPPLERRQALFRYPAESQKLQSVGVS